MIEKEEQQEAAVIKGPGQILKQARERANLSSQDIADKMKLKKGLIENIEQDNYDINLSLTFVRGYLKLYAKHVQVSEAEILSAFESLSTQKKEPAKLQSFSRRVANQANDDKLMLVTYLILAAVIALVVIWWFQQISTDSTTAINVNNPPESVSPEVIPQVVLPLEIAVTPNSETLISAPLDENMPIDNLGIATSEVELEPVIEENFTDAQPINAETVNDTSNLVVVADVLDTTVIETAAAVDLIFEFSGDCWMNLSDATGENIAFGVKVKGRVMPVSGIPPFVVTLGAPEVVQIRYAGEPLDMSFLPSGRIAKFDLPLSE
ncbi:MAG: cytoskeleton protein RodZ [Paraglaciecola sp.]|jgi:cytoskeleton protein RodZ